jgi:SAM-dependent methyltransferase
MGAVATRYTHEFVKRLLPDGAARILEVGCGNGELAARLMQDGLRVLALDSDEECVAAARAAGLDARQATWPCAIEVEFDAVVFTRSLHHIAPLEAAVAAAVAVLNPGGRIIVEDFRIEADSARTDAWFTGLVRSLDADGQLREESAPGRLLEKLDFGEHRVELHSSLAMAHALNRHGEVRQSDAAYYFRYLEGELRSPNMAGSLLEQELALINAGKIDALGKRFVLTPRGGGGVASLNPPG